MFFTWLKEKAWMLSTAAAVVLTIYLGLGLHNVTKDRDRLSGLLYDPHTGFVVKLSTCQANTAELLKEIKDQNDAIDTVKTEGQSRIDAAQKAVSEALIRANEASKKTAIMLPPPVGDTECAKAEDINARFTEMLK